MAEFGTKQTEISEVRSHSAPVNVPPAPALGVRGTTSLLNTLTGMTQSRRAAEQAAFIGQFTNTQLAEIQAVEQGVRPSAAARTRIRRNLATAINDYPGLADELVSANQAILGRAGMGDIVVEGTQQEQEWEKARNFLISSGQMMPGASDDVARQTYENAMLAAEAERRYNERMRTLNLESKTMEVEDQRRERREQITLDYAIDSLPAKKDQFTTQLTTIVDDPDASDAEKLAAVDQVWALLQDETSSLVAELSDTEAKALLKPFEIYRDVAVNTITGKYTTEAAEAEIKKAEATTYAIALRDPKVRQAVALSKIFPNVQTLGQQLDAINMVLGGMFTDNLDPTSENPANLFRSTREGKAAVEAYTRSISDLSAITDPEERKAAVEEQAQHLAQIFEGIEYHSSAIATSPEKAIKLVQWMATPQFYSARTKHAGAFTNLDTAKRVIQTHYGNEVVELAEREFNTHRVVTTPDPMEGRPRQLIGEGTPDRGQLSEEVEVGGGLVTYEWTGNGIRFVPIDLGDNPNPASVTAQEQSLKTLNNELAPVINNNVYAIAHLEGNQDYEKYFRQMESRLFEDGTPGRGDDEGDLSFDDFKEDEPMQVEESHISVHDMGGVAVNSYSNPIFTTEEGASNMVRDGADENMQATLQSYKRMVANFGRPVVINDAIAKVGTTRERQTPGSQHFHGNALDLSLSGLSEEEKYQLFLSAKKAGFTGFGFGSNILHVDRGPARGWAYGNTTFGGRNVQELIGSTYGGP